MPSPPSRRQPPLSLSSWNSSERTLLLPRRSLAGAAVSGGAARFHAFCLEYGLLPAGADLARELSVRLIMKALTLGFRGRREPLSLGAPPSAPATPAVVRVLTLTPAPGPSVPHLGPGPAPAARPQT